MMPEIKLPGEGGATQVTIEPKKIELYEFQRKDIAKLAPVTAGAIGSEMGTGKTHEAIALYEFWHDPSLPSLVVAPLNTHISWRDKFKAQSPGTRLFFVDRKNRDDFTMSLIRHDADVYIMHWQALRLMVDQLKKIKFSVIIGDEAHRISNREAKVTKAFKELKCDYKLAMSGTMTGDKPDKLWSVLNWLYPDYFKSYWSFRREYCIESVGYGGYASIIGVRNIDHLHSILKPFFVRHLKKEACCEDHPNGVMAWLPDKTYDTIEVELNAKQRRIYDQMEQQMVAWLGAHEDTPLVAQVVIAQLTRLSQIAIATPRMDVLEVRRANPYHEIDPSQPTHIYEKKTVINLEAPSSKIEAAIELIKDNPDKSFVVFSASKKACYLAAEEFKKVGIDGRVFSGDQNQYTRDQLIEGFRTKQYQVFIGVIAAASEGIDGLQDVCDTAIFLDRSWIAYENKQAEDRLHRGGQDNAVQIIDIIARDTCDTGRIQKLAMKWHWLKKILGDTVPDRTEQQ